MTASNAATVLSNIAQITARAEANVYMVKTLRTGGALDVESSYRVQVCMPAGNSSGGLNLSNLVIVDTLPTNAVFVSATNGGTYNAGTNQVTWPATTLTVGSGVRCVNRDVTVRFLDADFDVGDSVINSAEATATLVGGGTITVNTTDERLIQPPSPNMSFGKNGPSQALLGDIVGYNFTLANTGTAPLSNVQFEDVLPAELRVQRIYAGAGSPAVPLQIEYTTNLNASYTVLTGSPFAGSACVNIAPNTGGGCSSITLAGGEYITALRYRYTADLPFGFTATAAPRSASTPKLSARRSTRSSTIRRSPISPITATLPFAPAPSIPGSCHRRPGRVSLRMSAPVWPISAKLSPTRLRWRITPLVVRPQP